MGQEQELKWRIQDALRKVPMKAPAKTVMWDLVARIDPKTGVIPARHTPSLDDLADSTCLGRSTVATYLKHLEATSWVVRDRPEVADAINNGRRTQYRLDIGSFDLPSALKYEKQKRKPKKDSGGSGAEPSTVQELNHDGSGAELSKDVETGHDSSGAELSELGHGSGAESSMVQELNSDSSGAEHYIEPPTGVLSSSVHQSSSPPTGGDADAPPPDALFDLEDDHKAEQPPVDEKPKSNVVLAQWIDHCTAHDITLPKKVKGHYASRIAELLDQDIEPELIRDALIRMRERGFAGSPSKLGEFLVDVQNQRSTASSRAAPGKSSVSTKASIKKWKKDQQ